MPNWCHNEVTVYGKPDEIQSLVDAMKYTTKNIYDAEYEDYSFSHLYPCPEELSNTVSGFFSDPVEAAAHKKQQEANLEKYGFTDWYEWCVANWGTKWGDRNLDWMTNVDDNGKVAKDAEYACVRFDTAWSPPTALMTRVSEMYPNLTFVLFFTEESDAYVGYEVFQKGVLVTQHTEEPSIPKDILELLDKDDDEAYEKLHEWQLEYSDRVRDMSDFSIEKILAKK